MGSPPSANGKDQEQKSGKYRKIAEKSRKIISARKWGKIGKNVGK